MAKGRSKGLMFDLTFKMSSDVAELKKGVAEINGTMKSFVGTLKNVAGALAIREVIQFGMNLAKAADVQQKALAKVNQAIKTTGGAAGFTTKELAAMASQLQNESLFGDEVILNDVTAQLLTFTNIVGKQFQRAQQAALDLSTVLGSDLKGQTIQLGKALNDPVKGLLALRKSGISFSDAQIEVIKNLAETNRLAEAQTLILDELERQYGGQAKVAAQTALGPWQQMINQLGDLGEQMGSVFIPILNEVAKTISSLLPIFDNSTTRLEKLKLKFQESNDGLTDLLPKYEELKEKAKRSNEEQAELERITSKLAKLFPGAATALDGYLDVDVTKLKDLIEAQRELLLLQSKIELKNLSKKLELLEKQKKLQQDIINQGNIQLPTTFGTFSQFQPAQRTDATDKDIEKFQELELQIKETTFAISNLQAQLDSGFELDIKTPETKVVENAKETAKKYTEAFFEQLAKEAEANDKPIEVNVVPFLDWSRYRGEQPEELTYDAIPIPETIDGMSKLQEQAELLKDVMPDVGSAFIAAFTNGENAFEAFGNAFKRMISQMIAEFIQFLALTALLSAVTGTSFAAAGKEVGGYFAKLLGFGKKATGGFLDQGWNIVGENGMELVNSETGRVYSNNQTKAFAKNAASTQVVFKISKDELVGIMQKASTQSNLF